MVTQSPTVRRFAAAVAAVLGVLVVVGLMATRFPHRPAGTDYGPPPAGVPLLYVKDPDNTGWLIGFDWSGQPRGTVKLDPSLGPVGMAPDGQSFAVGFRSKGGTGQLLDRLGQPVPGAGGAVSGSALPIWADDNQHTCGIGFDSQGFNAKLVTVSPGQAVKSVAVLGGSQGRPGSFRIASCTFSNDQALVVNRLQSPAELLAVRLSTGEITSLHIYADTEQLSDVVASADSSLIAENSGQSVGQAGSGTPNTTIRKTSDRSVTFTLPPTTGVLAFSTDDSLAFVYTTPWAANPPNALAVVDVRSGQSIWSYSGPGVVGNVLAEPGGRDFAFYVRTPGVDDPLTDLMIVHADGTVTNFPQRYEPVW